MLLNLNSSEYDNQWPIDNWSSGDLKRRYLDINLEWSWKIRNRNYSDRTLVPLKFTILSFWPWTWRVSLGFLYQKSSGNPSCFQLIIFLFLPGTELTSIATKLTKFRPVASHTIITKNRKVFFVPKLSLPQSFWVVNQRCTNWASTC